MDLTWNGDEPAVVVAEKEPAPAAEESAPAPQAESEAPPWRLHCQRPASWKVSTLHRSR
jgi:hypothetical protein